MTPLLLSSWSGDSSEIRINKYFQDRPDHLQPLYFVSVDLSAEMAVASDDRAKSGGIGSSQSNAGDDRGAGKTK